MLGFIGQPQVRIEIDAVGKALRDALSKIEPDAMTPREAHDTLYALLRILGDDK